MDVIIKHLLQSYKKGQPSPPPIQDLKYPKEEKRNLGGTLKTGKKNGSTFPIFHLPDHIHNPIHFGGTLDRYNTTEGCVGVCVFVCNCKSVPLFVLLVCLRPFPAGTPVLRLTQTQSFPES